MNRSLKYKLDTAGIIAFVACVIAITFISKAMYLFGIDSENPVMIIVVEAFIAFASALFGPITGALSGFLGIVCANEYCGVSIMFVDAITLSAIGVMIGIFADHYGVRDRNFTPKNMYLFNLTHAMSLIAGFIFIRPYLAYIFEKKELFAGINTGLYVTVVCFVAVGIVVTGLLYIISKSISKKK
ncbi:MAG: ECF transporter S component [Lachnospiraceae bacterium]|nr:ECF transporter S component [Lachnospiraceae bacterium]